MRKLMCLLFVVAVFQEAQSQIVKKPGQDTTAINSDSAMIEDLKANLMDNAPVIPLDEDAASEGGVQNVATGIMGGRDPFYSNVAFNLSAARFKIRGYDGENFSTYMNGLPMESLDNGFTPFALWGGLTDVTRNKDVTVGLQHNKYGFGDIGSTTEIDTRASKQRRKTEFTYGYSNRVFTHRWSFTHSTGMNKKGWAFTVSGSRRWSDEGYVPGTYINGWSYFMAVDKKISEKTLVSLSVFASPTESGRAGVAVAEMHELTGNHYYNPNWGLQDGRRRNANISKTNEPYILLSHDHKFNAFSSILTSAGISFGERSSSSLDWFNARDPRPDYYKNLPSAQADSGLAAQIANQFRSNENVRQIDWSRLYDDNKSSVENFHGTVGHRAKYMLQEYVTNTKRITFNSVYNTKLSKHIFFTAGASYQYQINNSYKRLTDLLGADYHVDLNQFALRSFPLNDSAIQNDLNRPNRIVKVGDRYGYDYDMYFAKAGAWSQAVFYFKSLSFFAAIDGSNTQFWRVGNVRNGLFPTNSYGKSSVNNFNNYGVKGGASYKLNYRNTFYVNAAILTRAPNYDDSYNSPRTRNTTQDNLTSEKIQSIEGGYVLVAPVVKMRLSGYYSQFDNGMKVQTFYDDNYQTFVNYSISNISKQHFGAELGFDAKILPHLSLTGAAAVGRYYYNSRQIAVTTIDNDATVKGLDTVYGNNYRLGGTPQQAYNLGLSYRSPKYWFVSLNANYFDDMWLEINPVRRTYRAVNGVPYQSETWNSILAQEKFSAQFTMDLFAGYSWKLPSNWGLRSRSFIVFNLGVNNLLNNKNLISGGYEQLRFDFTGKSSTKFPSKYAYALGTNYAASISYRF